MNISETLKNKTPAEWWANAEQIIRQSGHLSTENNYVGGNGAWNVGRKHKVYIAHVLDTLASPCAGKAAIVGGMPGSGKSRMLPAMFDPTEYFVVDPDDIKDWLIENGLAPEVPGLTPRETAPLLHVESTILAKKLSEKLASIRANVIWPLTFSNAEAVANRISFATKNGYYRIDGSFVKVSVDTSTRRVRDRYAVGMRDYFNGVGFGGRFIDLENISRSYGVDEFRNFSKSFVTARVIDNDMDLM